MKAFNEKFRIAELEIKKLNYWTISLRPQQVTLGSLVLSLNRECPHLGEMTEKEGAELSLALSKIEQLLSKTFSPDKINYLALMMVDHQVHFHVIPRYENEIKFKGVYYQDKDWPKPANILDSYDLEESVLENIQTHFVQMF